MSVFQPIKAAICVVLSVAAFTATAEELPQPTGDIILTVSGNVSKVNSDAGAVFDLEMLEAYEQVTIETSTIWTEGVQVFTGVNLATLLEDLGITEGTLQATAINDYAVAIPVADVEPGGATIAYLLNGETMSVRDKGPLWIVFPYDSDPKYQAEVIYGQSIWQLDRIVVGE